MAAGNPFVPVSPQVQDPLENYARLVQLRAAIAQQGLMQGQQQLQGLDIQQQQMQLARTKALNDAFANSLTTDANGNPTFDKQKVIQSVAQAGQGSVIPDLNQKFMELDKLAGDVQKTRDEHNTAATNYMGRLAREIREANYDPTVAGMALAHAVGAGYGQEANLIRQQLNQNPGALKNVVDQLIAASPEQATVTKDISQANQAAAVTAKTNAETQWYREHGMAPGVSPDVQELADFEQKTGGSAAQFPAFKAGQEAQGRLPSQVALETNPAVINARVGQAVATEVGKERALAPQLQQITNTTRSGRKYISRDDIPQGSAGVVEQQAAKTGIPVVSKDTAGTLEDIDTALANQEYMLNTIGGKLAKDPTGRLYSAPANTIEKLAQTDPQLAAVGTFRNAAIQSMRAVAGSKGLRINQYEVQLAIENDIPKMTDTLPVAQQKLKNLQTFLNNAEQSHLVRNRAAAASASPGTLSPAGQAYLNSITGQH